MTQDASSAESGQRKKPGRLDRMMFRLFTRPATITAVETISERFKLIDFSGEAVKDGEWSPGQKIQIPLGGGMFISRTYTPIQWDKNLGIGRILGFAHGEGPGSDWVRTVKNGDECQIFGPRRSLDGSELIAATALFGDETSFGLAASIHSTGATARTPRLIFEVSSIVESQLALERLGLGAALLVEREAQDAHWPAIENHMIEAGADGGRLVLTGKAPSIQRVSRALKARGFESSRIRSKVYWAPGKAGLD